MPLIAELRGQAITTESGGAIRCKSQTTRVKALMGIAVRGAILDFDMRLEMILKNYPLFSMNSPT
jgi:hypothetical protein